jgi:hypothetical protein
LCIGDRWEVDNKGESIELKGIENYGDKLGVGIKWGINIEIIRIGIKAKRIGIMLKTFKNKKIA